MYVCMYVYMYVCMYTTVNIYIYICIKSSKYIIVIGKDVQESCPFLTYLRYLSQGLEGLQETAEYIADDSRAVRPDFNYGPLRHEAETLS